MIKTNPDAPKDILALLADNFKQGRPLLENAVLYRGTRVPDQTLGSYSKDVMHGSILSNVAASYTHNWKEETAFIGTYKIDRENTRFFQDFGMEQHLEGKPVPSLSVKATEHLLSPYVKEMVNAADSKTRSQAESRLEAVLKKHLYEANVPTTRADNQPNRPDTLFIYTGRPDTAFRQAVPLMMQKVGSHNESLAKAVMFAELRNPAVNRIHKLTASVKHGYKALAAINIIAQREAGAEMRAAHGHKPLNQLMADVDKTPLSESQAKLGRFAQALSEGINHPNPVIQGKSQAIAGAIETLDPSKASSTDLIRVSAAAGKTFDQAHAKGEFQASPKAETSASAPQGRGESQGLARG